MALLPDISGRFTFWSGMRGNCFVKEASGELGVPGQVMKHRVESEQTELSEGTGDDAGHLIAVQFGAPGGIENMGLQNSNMNRFAPKPLQEAFQGSGGSYRRLEIDWGKKLKAGYRIRVTVTDRYRNGENRPFTRSVHWTQTSPGGMVEQLALEFANFTSPQSRAKG